MFAIAIISGKQYALTQGMEIDVDHIDGAEGDTITIDKVLLRDTGKEVSVGQPLVKDSKIEAVLVKQYLGEKINVRRYKSKVRYRKSTGFRAHLTKLQIKSIV